MLPGLVLAGLALSAACQIAANPPKLLLHGSFHSVAHKGSGDARIVETADGQRILHLTRFRTYPARNLEICLIAARDAEDNETVLQSSARCLGVLPEKTANISFPLDRGLDLGRYRAVVIWNPSYGVNFTTAPLD